MLPIRDADGQPPLFGIPAELEECAAAPLSLDRLVDERRVNVRAKFSHEGSARAANDVASTADPLVSVDLLAKPCSVQGTARQNHWQ